MLASSASRATLLVAMLCMTAAVLADTPPPTTVQEDSFEASSEPAEGSQVDVLKEEDEMELATPSVNLDGGFGSLFPHVHPKAILAKAKAAKEAKEAAFKAKAKAKVDALVNHLYQKNKKLAAKEKKEDHAAAAAAAAAKKKGATVFEESVKKKRRKKNKKKAAKKWTYYTKADLDTKDKDWVKGGGEGMIIEHSNDVLVKQAAKEADVRFGLFSKRALAEDVKSTEAANNDVSVQMAKAMQEKRKFARKLARDHKQTLQDIKEITDETFHKKMVKERHHKAAVSMQEKIMKKLAKLKRDKRGEILYKKYCRDLKRVFIAAVPKNKAAYAATKC